MQYQSHFTAHRTILSGADKQELQTISNAYTLEQFRKDVRNYEEMTVDFVYTSAKIEGNTYDRIDTDNLLRMGITAGGKRYSDAIMLVNLRDAFSFAMQADEKMPLDLDYLGSLHKILMKDLLPLHEQGIGRTSPVSIGASHYKPLADAQRLRVEIKYIFNEATRYINPFEKAIYLHCNLAYLQYFRDGNKRAARLMQTAAMVQGNVLPLFFQDTLIDQYQRAIVGYYETGDYAPYVVFFKKNYKMVCQNFLGYQLAS